MTDCDLSRIHVFTEITPRFIARPFRMSSKLNQYTFDLQRNSYVAMTWPYNRLPNSSDLCLEHATLDRQLDRLVDRFVLNTQDATDNDSDQDYRASFIWDGYMEAENCYWKVRPGNGLPVQEVPFSD